MANIGDILIGALYHRYRTPRADIVLYDDLTYEHVVMPVIPPELPTVEQIQANETFNGATQDITLAGRMGLRSYTLENFLLPVRKNYRFIRPHGSDGEEIKEFIENRMKARKVMRIATTLSDGTEIINMACLCNSFKYSYDKVGDMRATISLQEYVYVNRSTNTTTTTSNTLSS